MVEKSIRQSEIGGMKAKIISAGLCDRCGYIHFKMMDANQNVVGHFDLSPENWDAMILDVEQQRALKAQNDANRNRI